MATDLSQWVKLMQTPSSTPGVASTTLWVDPSAPPEVQAAIANARRASADLGGVGGLDPTNLYRMAERQYAAQTGGKQATMTGPALAPTAGTHAYNTPIADNYTRPEPAPTPAVIATPPQQPALSVNPFTPPSAPATPITTATAPNNGSSGWTAPNWIGGQSAAPMSASSMASTQPQAPAPTIAANTPSPAVPGNNPFSPISLTYSSPLTSGGGVSNPQRNLQGEGSTTLNTLGQLLPGFLQLYGQGSSGMANSDLANLQAMLFGQGPSLNVSSARDFLQANPNLLSEITGQPNWGADGRSPEQWLVDHVKQSEGGEGGGRFTQLFNQWSSSNPQSSGITGLNQLLTGFANDQTIAGNRALRDATMADIFAFGPQALQAQQALNPQLYQNLNALDARAQGGLGTNPFADALGTQFQQGPQYQTASYNPTGPAQWAGTVNAGLVAPNTSFNSVQSPGADAALNNAMGRLGAVGPGSLQQTLEQQAAQDLALGRSLSAEDTRMAQQAAREAWSARGLAHSNGAIADEVLNRDALARQREAERRAFAAGVDQQGFGQRLQGLAGAIGVSDASRGYANLGLQAQQANLGAQLNSNALGLQGNLANQDAALKAALSNQQTAFNTSALNLANSQQNSSGALQASMANQGAFADALSRNQALGMNLASFGQSNSQQDFNNLLQAVQARGSTSFNPFSTIGGITTANQGTNSSLFGQGGAVTSGATGNQNLFNMLNPFNAYASDLYNTNANALWAQQNNAANNKAAKQSSTIGAIGSVIGAALPFIFCWAAREVYGEENPRWMQFREWVLTKAPEDFRSFYAAHGRLVAGFLRLNAAAKADVRDWMDAQIATLNPA